MEVKRADMMSQFMGISWKYDFEQIFVSVSSTLRLLISTVQIPTLSLLILLC